MRLALGLAALIATALALPAAAAEAAMTPPARQITVMGTGERSAVPDVATVTTGVVSQAKTAGEALSTNSQAMAAVLKALKDAGIAERDIQTSNFSIQPQYPSYDSTRITPPEIAGYQVSNQVSVRLRDVAKLGPVLDALVAAGSNNVSGVSFAIDKPEPLLNEARAEAVKNARAKAELYAEAAGVKLGRVIEISEASFGGPQPVFARMEAASAPSVPIAAGESTVTASVTIVYEIE